MKISHMRARLLVLATFGVALLLQLLLLLAPIPTKAQGGPGDSSPPTVSDFRSVVVQSIANPVVNQPYETTFRVVYTDTQTTLSGRLAGSLARFLSVEATEGYPVFDPYDPFSWTLFLQNGGPQLRIWTVLEPLAPSLHQQFLFSSRVFTPTNTLTGTGNTLAVAAAHATQFPQAVTLGYRAAALTSSLVYTDTLELVPNVNITGTVVTGQLFDTASMFRSVDSDILSCSQDSLSSFVCLTDAQSDTTAHITISVRSLDVGFVQRTFNVEAGGDSISHSVTTNVLPPVNPPSVQPVLIDIKPGGFPNSINPWSRGKIPVALLSTSVFDVLEIDPSSLTFGRTGFEDSLEFCHPEDSNGDGLLDQVCHFDTRSAGFTADDTLGRLNGSTYSGLPVQGMDSVRIVGRKK